MPEIKTEAPYSGAELDSYSSNPERQLVIETKLGTMKLQLFDKIAPKHVEQITRLAGEKTRIGGLLPKALKKLKGDKFIFPSPSIVLANAIGLGAIEANI